MKINPEEQRQRLSLTILYSIIILIILVITIGIASIILLLLIYNGSIQINYIQIKVSTFILHLVAWSVVIGFIITVVTSRVSLKPINKILDAMSRLASGDYSVRLSFKGALADYPLTQELTNSFNAMAAELEQTEILRSDFINNFSHEFKTPIVSIAGFAKLLKHGDLPPEQQREYLDIIEEESMRLARMSTNVLDLTKVESQTILTDVQTYNLSEQIRTCVLMLEGKWTKKNIEMSLPEEEFEITGSKELLKLVWVNLLDNAIKFSADYEPVDVRIHQDEGQTSVEISNYCEDIPADKLPKLFTRFYQADESHASEGNGVGLAIVKKVINLHKGTIQVTSEGGKTCFTVTIPS